MGILEWVEEAMQKGWSVRYLVRGSQSLPLTRAEEAKVFLFFPRSDLTE